MGIISKAIDRAESMRLRGHIAAAGDRIHCSAIGSHTVNNAHLRARRGRQGLTPDWLLAAIAEASDDEDLESGDCLRLLSEVTAAGMGVQQEAEDLIFSEDSWVSMCRSLGLLNRHEVDVQDSDDDDDELAHPDKAHLAKGAFIRTRESEVARS